MSKRKKNSLIGLLFVLVVGLFADRRFLIAIFVENLLISLFIVGVSVIALAGLIAFYKDHKKSSRINDFKLYHILYA